MTTAAAYTIDQYLDSDDSIRFRVIWNDGGTSDKTAPQGFLTKKEAEEFATLVNSCDPNTCASPAPWVVEQTAMQFVIKAPNDADDYLHKIIAVTAGLQSNNAANARLIAAAPELLDALSDLLNDAIGGYIIQTNGNGDPDKVAVFQKAQAAIAKAEGISLSA